MCHFCIVFIGVRMPEWQVRPPFNPTVHMPIGCRVGRGIGRAYARLGQVFLSAEGLPL